MGLKNISLTLIVPISFHYFSKNFIGVSSFALLCQFQVYSKADQLYISIYSLFFSFLGFSPIQATAEYCVPCAVQQVLFIYFLYSSVCVSPHLPPPLHPLVTVAFFLHPCLYFCFVNQFIYTLFSYFQYGYQENKKLHV